jgi:CRISPR-associated protein Cmr2
MTTQRNKYLGITIGPIYNTIAQARKTREVWLGSFFFSHVMKLIMRFFKENPDYGEFFARDTTKLDSNETYHGAGLYDDRCYIRLKEGVDFSQNDYNDLVSYVIDELKKLGTDGELAKKYLQIYCTVQTVDSDKEALKTLNDHLEVMELQAKYNPDYIYALASGYEERQQSEIKRFLPNRIEGELEKWYASGFARNEDTEKFKEGELIYYDIDGGIYSFPSILEISTQGLKRKDSSSYDAIHKRFEEQLKQEIDESRGVQIKGDKMTDDKILDEIRKLYKGDFQTAHKYIAIVYADGDNIGKLVTTLSKTEPDKLISFSENLIKYGISASNLIHEYGGKPIYIGGDDLFFFAPIISYDEGTKENTNIFDLIEKLDKTFNDLWKEWLNKQGPEVQDIKPCLSYGLSITYYKYPMNESIALAKSLLFDTAKKYPTEEKPDKNSIAIKLMTHSGSFDQIVMNKETGKDFDKLINFLCTFKDRDAVISSVLQRLRDDNKLLLAIAEDGEDADFSAYFDNEYDMDLMRDVKKKEYIEKSKALFKNIFSSNKNKEEGLKQLCTLYRLLNFLIHKEI